jgi:hypothetical protein
MQNDSSLPFVFRRTPAMCLQADNNAAGGHLDERTIGPVDLEKIDDHEFQNRRRACGHRMYQSGGFCYRFLLDVAADQGSKRRRRRKESKPLQCLPLHSINTTVPSLLRFGRQDQRGWSGDGKSSDIIEARF